MQIANFQSLCQPVAKFRGHRNENICNMYTKRIKIFIKRRNTFCIKI